MPTGLCKTCGQTYKWSDRPRLNDARCVVCDGRLKAVADNKLGKWVELRIKPKDGKARQERTA